MGNSGVFGASQPNETIDDLNEVKTAVDDIIDDPEVETETPNVEYDLEKAQLAAGIVQAYIKRVRLLTIAVVAIVLYLVIKES